MPIRWASGEVPIYQLLLAMALTAATSVLLVSVASSIYRRAHLITGHRVRLLEVINGRTLPRHGKLGTRDRLDRLERLERNVECGPGRHAASRRASHGPL